VSVLDVHHFNVVAGSRLVGCGCVGTPVALEDGRGSPTSLGNPADRREVEDLTDKWARRRLGLNHPPDDGIEGALIGRVSHKGRGNGLLNALGRAEKVARVVGLLTTAEWKVALRRAERTHKLLIRRGVLGQRHSARVTLDVLGFGRCEGFNKREVTLPQRNPSRAIVGKERVGGDFEDDETEGEDIGRLVDLSLKDFGAEVLAISLCLDVPCSRPGGGHSKVADLECAIESNQDVGRLKIEMDKPGIVDGVQTLSL